MKKTPFALLLLVFSTTFFACSSKDSRPKIQTTYIGDNAPVQETWNAEVTFSDSGRVKAILHIKHSAQYRRRNLDEREIDGGFRVDFYNRQGEFTTVLTAERAKIHPSNDMEAFENVVITSNDSTIVRTDYMKWSHNEQKISSNKFVTITKPNEVLRGYGFESDQNMKHYRIFRASGETTIEDDTK
ncbi:protein of unknown function DUF1239 [Chloroherpeton thalassium ATCC 35110]|uniref:LPS export ABC transporter periplasmic protein LptC n=1 Tax=Chloroherpeton thalassium (strain ATCC 35110 / GB-78) TaxID=517418 RepID=B3QTQ4_CHLT3|nr:LPS export ABC transporter periplasmic protein LptC [Chloroherpeton thalassium]ACF14252.1 protein of unknown function DUF1239 [Chloroherpeton thalassium ATCC 35110]